VDPPSYKDFSGVKTKELTEGIEEIFLEIRSQCDELLKFAAFPHFFFRFVVRSMPGSRLCVCLDIQHVVVVVVVAVVVVYNIRT